MRHRVWIGSLAVHAVVGALLATLVTHRDEHPAPRAAITIETIDVAAPPAPQSPIASPGGGGGGGEMAKPRIASSVEDPRDKVRAAAAAASVEDPRGEVRRDTATTASAEDPRGEIHYESSATSDGAGGAGTGGGTGGGDGTGQGTGHGAGIGFGDGGGIAEQLAPVAVPPAPKVSKARPARLIFPSRQRDVEDAALFVMRVTVDSDGYVAGAKLVRGFGGRRDEVAADQIWRFRYEPALDDDGNPVRSVLEQRFLVQ